MEQSAFPTKANLILTKHTLALARQGYDLLDKKRIVLIRERASLHEQAEALRRRLNAATAQAQAALLRAQLEMGSPAVEAAAQCIPLEATVQVQARSIMGVEVPQVCCDPSPAGPEALPYGLGGTTAALDEALRRFAQVKTLALALAEADNTAQRLSLHIRKTQKRANALRYVFIPKYESRLRFIQEQLEERERDGFVRMKMGKAKVD